MSFRNILFLIILFCFSVGSAKAQYERPVPTQQKSFWDRIYIGGNFGLQFGTVTSVDLEPQIGYRITERLTSGVGITYIYYKYTDSYYNYTFSTNIYGGSIFSRYLVFENLFAHAELEQLSLEVYDFLQKKITRQWIPAFLVGGGYRQPIGERSAFQLLALYDVIQDRNSPHQNPVIRIGFGFGF